MKKNPNGLSTEKFDAMAAQFCHDSSTAKQYYDITRPTENAVRVSLDIQENLNASTSSRCVGLYCYFIVAKCDPAQQNKLEGPKKSIMG